MKTLLTTFAEGDLGPRRRKWWFLVPAVLLDGLSAYLFVKYMAAWAAFRTWGPVTDVVDQHKLADLVHSYRSAQASFLWSVAVAALGASLMVPIVQLNGIRSKGFTLLVRYLLALILCVFTIGLFVSIMDVLRWG